MLTFQERAAAWRQAKYPGSTPAWVFVKLVEEVGEIARALVGDNESRNLRGDVGDEAAQTLLVLASFIGMFYPGRDLLAEAEAELARHERAIGASNDIGYDFDPDDELPYCVAGDLRCPARPRWTMWANYDAASFLRPLFPTVSFDPEFSCFFAHMATKAEQDLLGVALIDWLVARRKS